ncbi:hypothetical protein BJ742DRAFT_345040 [Cladochytrium replicatum]|nr:hypothetical protein BJ742DRAFT_345040 [Cladochytrium replicatum]
MTLIGSRELQIVQKAQSCADIIRNGTHFAGHNSRGVNYEVPLALHAICRRFYRTPAFSTKYSAFKMDAVASIYDRLYDDHKQNFTAKNRTLSYWANPLLSGKGEISDFFCVWELQYYFLEKDFYIPRKVQVESTSHGERTLSPKFFICCRSCLTPYSWFSLPLLIIVLLNIRPALNYADPPACLRPLLATSTLTSTNQASGLTHSKKPESERLIEEGLIEEGGRLIEKNDGIIPQVKVAVHGSGPIAEKLQEFLGLLGFLADAEYFEGGRVKRAAHTLPRSPNYRTNMR